jgi:hypothetical protein
MGASLRRVISKPRCRLHEALFSIAPFGRVLRLSVDLFFAANQGAATWMTPVDEMAKA